MNNQYLDELDILNRVQTRRYDVLQESEEAKAFNAKTDQDVRALKNYKQELAARVEHEL